MNNKPLFSDQTKSSDKITSIEVDRSFTQGNKIAEILNNFFFNAA